MTTSRRSIIATHVIAGKTHRCPICQSVIAQDFAEALAMERGALPNEYDAASIAREIEADHLRRIAALERLDFATTTRPPVSPNDTQPFILSAADLVAIEEPVGFEVVS